MGLFKSKTFWTIVYLFLFITSIYWGWAVCFSPQEWLALIGALIFGAVLMFQLFDFIFKEREYKRKHSEDLVREVFEKTVEIGSWNYHDDKISCSYASWAKDSKYISYAEQHLKDKKYKKTYQAYVEWKKCDKNIIDQIVGKIKQYRELVEQELNIAEIPLPASDEYLDARTEHYNRTSIKNAMFDDLQSIIKNGKKRYELTLVLHEKMSRLKWSEVCLAVGKGDSVKWLQPIIERIENNEKIINIIKEINSLNNQLKSNTELEQFEKGRKEIIKQVKYDGKPC